MQRLAPLTLSIAVLLGWSTADAQVRVVPAARQEALLNSPDAKLARNKKLVYDFWREIVDAGRIEQIDKYVAENYIQHNPNVPTGRLALVEHIAKNVKRQAAQPRVNAPYAGAAHSFDLDIIPQRYLGKMLGHNKVAAEDSRQRMVDFFVAHTVGIDWRKAQLSKVDDRLAGLTP